MNTIEDVQNTLKGIEAAIDTVFNKPLKVSLIDPKPTTINYYVTGINVINPVGTTSNDRLDAYVRAVKERTLAIQKQNEVNDDIARIAIASKEKEPKENVEANDRVREEPDKLRKLTVPGEERKEV